MRNKFFFILILSFGLLNISAQEKPTNAPKTISGGVLNGKATSLPKPTFPKAAIAVNASGAVTVKVTIDENGKVVSATAISGHPLLRQASEQAAMTALFAPTKLEGQPVRINGVLVYNFVLPMTFTQIGYELSQTKETQTISKNHLDDVRGTLRRDWTEETEIIRKLNALLTAKSEKEEIATKSTPSKSDATTKAKPLRTSDAPIEFKGVQGNVRTIQGDRDLVSTDSGGAKQYSLNDDSTVLLTELQSKLESRLEVNDNIIWSFRLGTILGKLKAQIDGNEKIQASIAEINQLRTKQPIGISEPVAAQVEELVKTAEKIGSDIEKSKSLLPIIENLRTLRGF